MENPNPQKREKKPVSALKNTSKGNLNVRQLGSLEADRLNKILDKK